MDLRYPLRGFQVQSGRIIHTGRFLILVFCVLGDEKVKRPIFYRFLRFGLKFNVARIDGQILSNLYVKIIIEGEQH